MTLLVKFQFQMVRLKAPLVMSKSIAKAISIPDGSIKRSYESPSGNFSLYISIPDGSIKRSVRPCNFRHRFRISIPDGSIKRKYLRNEIANPATFQFQMVRLKEDGRS